MTKEIPDTDQSHPPSFHWMFADTGASSTVRAVVEVQRLRACCNRAATELQQSFNKGCSGSLHHRTGRHAQTQLCCSSVAVVLQLCCRSIAALLQLCCSSSRSDAKHHPFTGSDVC
jgi:hypothetical protein